MALLGAEGGPERLEVGLHDRDVVVTPGPVGDAFERIEDVRLQARVLGEGLRGLAGDQCLVEDGGDVVGLGLRLQLLELSPKAKGLAQALRQNWNIEFDDAGAIGRRYRRQDEIGTPFCVTVDFDTLDDNAVTVRERDTMKQERVSLDQIEGYLASRLVGC
ncbi:hypothetical protein STENM223S_00610 [Streptomyces tendae]